MAEWTSELLAEAARAGDVATLAAALAHDSALRDIRAGPHGATLLHLAAQHGRQSAVELLLRAGVDANVREWGDDTFPIHWAAAGGHLDVVRLLADAGGDVVGGGDDHALGVIGWATCWGAPQVAVADFLVRRGARHHIFSAISMGLGEEVRRIVAESPAELHRRLTRSDNGRAPLHHAVLARRREMVTLLLELGADPFVRDGFGYHAPAYATETEVDLPILQAMRIPIDHEFESARRGSRPVVATPLDLLALVGLHDWEGAERAMTDRTSLSSPGDATGGALHLMAKRGDEEAVGWLLAHRSDPNALWPHWDSEVTALQLAILGGHDGVASLLLENGADPDIRDSKHGGGALDWAEHFGRAAIVRMLRGRTERH